MFRGDQQTDTMEARKVEKAEIREKQREEKQLKASDKSRGNVLGGRLRVFSEH